MDRYGFIAVLFIFVLASKTSDASAVFHLRKLITTGKSSASTSSQVSPAESPIDEPRKNPINAAKSEKERHKESHNSGDPSPPAGKNNGGKADKGNAKAANSSTPKLRNNYTCEGSLTRCHVEGMLACIEASKEGSKGLFIVVRNEGKSALKVNVNLPNLKNVLPAFDVPKDEARRMNITSTKSKNTELFVNSGNAKCLLHLVNPVSVDNLIRQLSFYSKQVTPAYAVYASFLLVLFLGGIWACCKLRKRNRENGIPYQELEMGLPESTSAVHVDAAEGWDHDWDNDWDEETAIKSPAAHQIRNISADGLTSRSSKKDGWENDWED